jgi:hypothetical protein
MRKIKFSITFSESVKVQLGMLIRIVTSAEAVTASQMGMTIRTRYRVDEIAGKTHMRMSHHPDYF